VTNRPVFHAKLGKFFKALRKERNLGQRQAACLAAHRNLRLTQHVLLRLEKGKTKNPDPEVLRAMADLYNVPYEWLVQRWTRERYGIDVAEPVRLAAPNPLTDEEQDCLRAWRALSEDDRIQFFRFMKRVAEATAPSGWFQDGKYIGPERRRA
jgi:transcriptional regulator with XRE-family HTH domain